VLRNSKTNFFVLLNFVQLCLQAYAVILLFPLVLLKF
jgi:hypothetical protein